MIWNKVEVLPADLAAHNGKMVRGLADDGQFLTAVVATQAGGMRSLQVTAEAFICTCLDEHRADNLECESYRKARWPTLEEVYESGSHLLPHGAILGMQLQISEEDKKALQQTDAKILVLMMVGRTSPPGRIIVDGKG